MLCLPLYLSLFRVCHTNPPDILSGGFRIWTRQHRSEACRGFGSVRAQTLIKCRLCQNLETLTWQAKETWSPKSRTRLGDAIATCACPLKFKSFPSSTIKHHRSFAIATAETTVSPVEDHASPPTVGTHRRAGPSSPHPPPQNSFQTPSLQQTCMCCIAKAFHPPTVAKGDQAPSGYLPCHSEAGPRGRGVFRARKLPVAQRCVAVALTPWKAIGWCWLATSGKPGPLSLWSILGHQGHSCLAPAPSAQRHVSKPWPCSASQLQSTVLSEQSAPCQAARSQNQFLTGELHPPGSFPNGWTSQRWKHQFHCRLHSALVWEAKCPAASLVAEAGKHGI